jgi:hypothetical protein
MRRKRFQKNVRQAPKGRRVDPVALADVQALLGNGSRQRDLPIELMQGDAWKRDSFNAYV